MGAAQQRRPRARPTEPLQGLGRVGRQLQLCREVGRKAVRRLFLGDARQQRTGFLVAALVHQEQCRACSGHAEPLRVHRPARAVRPPPGRNRMAPGDSSARWRGSSRAADHDGSAVRNASNAAAAASKSDCPIRPTAWLFRVTSSAVMVASVGRRHPASRPRARTTTTHHREARPLLGITATPYHVETGPGLWIGTLEWTSAVRDSARSRCPDGPCCRSSGGAASSCW